MNADQFRKLIMKKYRECMEDCQIPTGALSHFNPAEFFAYDQWEDNKKLRNDLVLLSVAITEMEKCMRDGFFNSVVSIAEEHMDIVNKYNPIDDWLMIKKSNHTALLNEVTSLGLKLGPEMYVPRSITKISHIIENCFHNLEDTK